MIRVDYGFFFGKLLKSPNFRDLVDDFVLAHYLHECPENALHDTVEKGVYIVVLSVNVGGKIHFHTVP